MLQEVSENFAFITYLPVLGIRFVGFRPAPCSVVSPPSLYVSVSVINTVSWVGVSSAYNYGVS
jgi:hypothetical protein